VLVMMPLSLFAGEPLLTYIMPGKVFGGSPDRHLRLEDLQPHFRPLAHRLKLDSTIKQCLRKVSSVCFQRIRPNNNRPRGFVSFEEAESFSSWEQIQEFLREVLAVAVVCAYVL